jgi:hypothetical protein
MNLKHLSISRHILCFGVTSPIDRSLIIVQKGFIQLYYKLWLTQDVSFGTMNLDALITTMIRHCFKIWTLVTFDKYVLHIGLAYNQVLEWLFKTFWKDDGELC